MTLVSVDLGAEYVDVAVVNDGRCTVWKATAETTDPTVSVVSAVAVALDHAGSTMAQVDELRLGTTTGVNALLRRKGARVALITTRGFADCLALGRQNRADLYDPVARSPAPTFLAARADTFEIAGRIAANGAEVAAPDAEEIAVIAQECARRGIRDIAVSLLFAHVDPAHELFCATHLTRAVPGLRVTLSHRVDPQSREYERTVAACLEAWLAPGEIHLLESIGAWLQAHGFAGRLTLANGLGALVPLAAGCASVSRLLGGGPAATLRAAAAIADLAGAGAIVALDIGSTSSDIGLVRAGVLPEVEEATFAGVPQRQPMVDITSVGLGARSVIARHRLGDAVRAGQGTVLDAARDALVQAVITHCVRRNFDPANAALVASGGLGPALAGRVAGALGMTRILIPAAPEVAGALGLLLCASLAEVRGAQNHDFDGLSDDGLARACGDLGRALGTGTAQVEYLAQAAPNANMHRITLALGPQVPTADGLRAAINAHFRETYGIACPGAGHLFALIARSQGDDARALPPVTPTPVAEGLGLRTACGLIEVPEGWRIAQISPTHVELNRRGQDG